MSTHSQSKVIKSDNYSWQGVERRDYKTDDSLFKDVHRYTLLGPREDEQALNFETRYFEVGKGGYTSLEYHRHPHSVVVIRGAGRVIIGEEVHEISAHDVVFIAPYTLHQFQADEEHKLGFICVVDRYRDRPTVPDDEDLQSLDNDRVLSKIKR